METKTAIYRCKPCGATWRLVLERLSPGRVRDQHGIERATHYGVPAVPCPTCAKPRHGDQVKGTVTAEACGAKCQAAKGPSCDCSCGGANHGANHG